MLSTEQIERNVGFGGDVPLGVESGGQSRERLAGCRDRRSFFRLLRICGAGGMALVGLAPRFSWASIPDQPVFTAGSQTTGVPSWGPLAERWSQRLEEDFGLDGKIFSAVWFSCFAQKNQSADIFLESLWTFVDAAGTDLIADLQVVGELLSRTPLRAVVTGQTRGLHLLDASDVRQLLSEMGRSAFAFRRRISQGLVVVTGIAHYATPQFQKDAGYPGVPLHVQMIWK